MRKGSKSFAQFSPWAIFGVVGFAAVTGSLMPLIGLLGVFFTMQYCNRLDRRSIREGSKR